MQLTDVPQPSFGPGAIVLIESGKYPLEKLHTHCFRIEQAEQAIRTLVGLSPGMKATHVAIRTRPP